jgi:hypothetical protein
MASSIYLSTITRIIAERGYYVFPVAVVDAMMKDNGVPTPDQMANIPLKKIREVINPDSVLYLTILQWGTKYKLITTYDVVQIHGILVDTRSGIVLWEGEHTVVDETGNGNNGSKLANALVAAILKKIGNSIADPSPGLARKANKELFLNYDKGLLFGHRHIDFSQKNQKK